MPFACCAAQPVSRCHVPNLISGVSRQPWLHSAASTTDSLGLQAGTLPTVERGCKPIRSWRGPNQMLKGLPITDGQGQRWRVEAVPEWNLEAL